MKRKAHCKHNAKSPSHMHTHTHTHTKAQLAIILLFDMQLVNKTRNHTSAFHQVDFVCVIHTRMHIIITQPLSTINTPQVFYVIFMCTKMCIGQTLTS
jgi:hypothetical protein